MMKRRLVSFLCAVCVWLVFPLAAQADVIAEPSISDPESWFSSPVFILVLAAVLVAVTAILIRVFHRPKKSRLKSTAELRDAQNAASDKNDTGA